MHPIHGVWPRDGIAGWIEPVSLISTWWAPIVMLLVSNVFMTVAWYGHLKHQDASLMRVILDLYGRAFAY